MSDGETDLRERFAQLRAEERRGVPPFGWQPRERKRPRTLRVIAAAAALLLVLIISIAVRPHAVRFTESDRAAVRSMSGWNPPTDFLLRTPGSELLTTTPRIPDLKGISR